MMDVENRRQLLVAATSIIGSLVTGGWTVDGDGSRLPRVKGFLPSQNQPQPTLAVSTEPLPLYPDYKIHLGPGVKSDSTVFNHVHPFLERLVYKKNILGIDMPRGESNENFQQAKLVYADRLRSLRGRNAFLLHSIAGAIFNSVIPEVLRDMDPEAAKELRVAYLGCGDRGSERYQDPYKVYKDPERVKVLKEALAGKFELLTGERDGSIPSSQGKSLAKLLGDKDDLVHFYEVPGFEHADIINAPLTDLLAKQRIIRLLQAA